MPGPDHPPGTGQPAEPFDWASWWLECLDALVTRVTAASIDWGTDPDGDPYVIPGQRRPSGITYPHAMVLDFAAAPREDDSTRSDEHFEIEAELAVFDRADPREYRTNLRKMIAQIGAVQTALYTDRSLGGACENLWIFRSTPMEMETDRGDETVGDVQLRISKTATHPY